MFSVYFNNTISESSWYAKKKKIYVKLFVFCVVYVNFPLIAVDIQMIVYIVELQAGSHVLPRDPMQ